MPDSLESVRLPVPSSSIKRLYRHISQEVCPWNREFSQELAEDSPFRARPFLDGKDAVTLARDILALEQAEFSAAFKGSPMKRAKLAGLRRNASVVLRNREAETPASLPAVASDRLSAMATRPVSLSVQPLQRPPDSGLSAVGTPASRVALVAILTAEAWALAGATLPAYARGSAPVSVRALREAVAVRERPPAR